jgi:hypothetical protein
VAEWLLGQGHQVFSVYDQACGMDDDSIVRMAFNDHLKYTVAKSALSFATGLPYNHLRGNDSTPRCRLFYLPNSSQ